MKWLAGGASIQQVVADFSYENAPSFVTMFRKALGTLPVRYVVERHAMAGDPKRYAGGVDASRNSMV